MAYLLRSSMQYSRAVMLRQDSSDLSPVMARAFTLLRDRAGSTPLLERSKPQISAASHRLALRHISIPLGPTTPSERSYIGSSTCAGTAHTESHARGDIFMNAKSQKVRWRAW